MPRTWAKAHFHFEKVADRAAWDFALLSIAAAIKVDGGKVADARLVCGAVACVPHRLTAVEKSITGSAISGDAIEKAALLATEGAEPLQFNQFKIPLLQNLVRRALRSIPA